MNIKEITELLNSSFKQYKTIGNCMFAPTGEKFITYSSAGSVREGEQITSYYSAEEAIDEFERTVKDIIKLGKGTIYWRLLPELVQEQDVEKPYYFVRSRFRISEKPLNKLIVEKYYV